MENNLQILIRLKKEDDETLEEAVANVIMGNESKFMPLLERLIDLGDANTSVTEGSLNVDVFDVDISGAEGNASCSFLSFYYASCKNMRSESDHEVDFPFEIKDDNLIFDIKLPLAWRPGEYD